MVYQSNIAVIVYNHNMKLGVCDIESLCLRCTCCLELLCVVGAFSGGKTRCLNNIIQPLMMVLLLLMLLLLLNTCCLSDAASC